MLFDKPIQARGAVLRAPDGGRVVSFRASTPTVDSHGTSIKPMGIKTERFDSNPIFLWGHDGYGSMFGGGPSIDSVIGRIVAYNRSEDAFDIDVEFASEDVNSKAEQAFRLVKAGFLNAVSIGFRVLKWHTEGDGDSLLYVFDEVELLEVSLVPIPSNPDAVALVRSMVAGFDPQALPPQTQERAPEPVPDPIPPQPDATEAAREILGQERLRIALSSAVRQAIRR